MYHSYACSRKRNSSLRFLFAPCVYKAGGLLAYWLQLLAADRLAQSGPYPQRAILVADSSLVQSDSCAGPFACLRICRPQRSPQVILLHLLALSFVFDMLRAQKVGETTLHFRRRAWRDAVPPVRSTTSCRYRSVGLTLKPNMFRTGTRESPIFAVNEERWAHVNICEWSDTYTSLVLAGVG